MVLIPREFLIDLGLCKSTCLSSQQCSQLIQVHADLVANGDEAFGEIEIVFPE